MERQRREEWERGKKEELARRRGGEQEEISRLRAKKKSLELELEAVVRERKRSETVHTFNHVVSLKTLHSPKGQQAQADLRPPPGRSEQEVDPEGRGGPGQSEEGRTHR